jgi:hypothetical protein
LSGERSILVSERLVITEGKAIHLLPNLLGNLAMYHCGRAGRRHRTVGLTTIPGGVMATLV